MKKDTDNLLARYFGGNATEQDMQALEQWISLSSENQLYFDEMTNLYAKIGSVGLSDQKPNTERAKETFRAYIASQKSEQKSEQKPQIFAVKHKPFYKTWMFQAASIAIVLMLSISGWLFFNAEHDVILATQTTLKEGILSDLTQIKLSKNSKIIYSSKYGKKSRKIRLEGKAFFAVGQKGNGTLQINADETFIEDIGTKFTVSAYPNNYEVSVNVNEGKVHFYTSNNNGIVLSSNETGIYNKQTKEFHILRTKTDTIAAEIKHVQFNAVLLREAMTIISKEYGVIIRFEQLSIGNRKITVNFDGENVNMVLQVIAETLDLKVTKDAEGYLLSENKKPLN